MEVFTRISTASSGNTGRKATEFEAVNDLRNLYDGIRVNVGMSDAGANGIAVSPAGADLTHLASILPYCLDIRKQGRPLKIQLGLGGEGPPNNAAWRALNGGTSWLYNRRPPTALFSSILAIQQAAFDYVYDYYSSRGFRPQEYVSVEYDNEPGLGGSGASGVPYIGNTDGTGSPFNLLAEGTWDDSSVVTATAEYASAQERFAYGASRFNKRGCLFIAPGLETQSGTTFAQELATCNSSTDRHWPFYGGATLNGYTSAANQTLSMGHVKFAEVWGDATKAKIDLIRATEIPAVSMLQISEAGVNPNQAGMNGNKGRPTNYKELGEYRLAQMDQAAFWGLHRFIFYTLSDTSSASVDDQHGLLNDANQYYSAYYSFAKRAKGGDITGPPSGSYVTGASEPAVPST